MDTDHPSGADAVVSHGAAAKATEMIASSAGAPRDGFLGLIKALLISSSCHPAGHLWLDLVSAGRIDGARNPDHHRRESPGGSSS